MENHINPPDVKGYPQVGLFFVHISKYQLDRSTYSSAMCSMDACNSCNFSGKQRTNLIIVNAGFYQTLLNGKSISKHWIQMQLKITKSHHHIQMLIYSFTDALVHYFGPQVLFRTNKARHWEENTLFVPNLSSMKMTCSKLYSQEYLFSKKINSFAPP